MRKLTLLSVISSGKSGFERSFRCTVSSCISSFSTHTDTLLNIEKYFQYMTLDDKCAFTEDVCIKEKEKFYGRNGDPQLLRYGNKKPICSSQLICIWSSLRLRKAFWKLSPQIITGFYFIVHSPLIKLCKLGCQFY